MLMTDEEWDEWINDTEGMDWWSLWYCGWGN